MKRSIAIILLVIYLYNVGGQLVFHQYLVYKSDKFFNEQINKSRYNVNDLTEVIIPVDMPGITDWNSYEHLSGQVKFKNASYNYIKIKVTRTALYLLCIPNYETTHLTDQNIIDARGISDIPVPRKDHVPFGKVDFVASFIQQVCRYEFLSLVTALPKNIYNGHAIMPNPFITGRGQPPDLQPVLS